jgi:hypothetical protein
MGQTHRIATLALVLALLASAPALQAQTSDLPPGWVRAGSQPQDYEMGTDPKGGRAGGPAGFIKGKTTEARGFGTLMQMFDAAEYRGKRIRFSASVKAAGIEKWAGLWMRIDGVPAAGSRAPAMLGFDNMQGRPIKGTSDWKPYQVVLDVPDEAQAIAFGILLEGPGQAWMDDLKLEPVGREVAVTNPARALPAKPNLKFDP